VQWDPVNYGDPSGLQMRAPICYWSPIMQAGPEGWGFTGYQGEVCYESGGGGGGVFRPDPVVERWDNLSEGCKKGLTDAL